MAVSKPAAESKLTDISGIGLATARILEQHGFESPAQLASASIDKLSALPGFGAKRSASLIAAAQATKTLSAATPNRDEEKKKKKKKDGKGKKDKKKRGKKKDRKKKDKKDKKKGKSGKKKRSKKQRNKKK